MANKGTIVIALYFRTSTSKQETASQRSAIARWVKERGYAKAKILEYADDGITGAVTSRPSFQRMIADVRAGKIQKIVTFELSRLSRDFIDMLNVMRLLADHGVTVEVPGEGTQPFATAMEQFMVCAKSLVSSQEREHIRRRVKEGLAAAKARGVKLGAPKGAKRRKGKFKDHDPLLVERIIKKINKGKQTYREISEDVGLSPATITRIFQRYGAI
jgi:DNA invertase Pin-like site-specific DNA recombinase